MDLDLDLDYPFENGVDLDLDYPFENSGPGLDLDLEILKKMHLDWIWIVS